MQLLIGRKGLKSGGRKETQKKPFLSLLIYYQREKDFKESSWM